MTRQTEIEKISITIPKHLLDRARDLVLNSTRYKTRSHLFEIALDDLLWKEQGEILRKRGVQK